MSVLKPNSIWIDTRGKEFVVIEEKDNMVWYTHKDTVYSCRSQAFQERFKPVENYK
jgi:hypothetical protein